MEQTKPFNISKQSVLEAFKKVKANKGGAGVDRQTIEEFERNLKDNLYKIRKNPDSFGIFLCLKVRICDTSNKNIKINKRYSIILYF